MPCPSTVDIIGIVSVWEGKVTLTVTTITQKPEHSACFAWGMFVFFYAYSLYKRCIIGIGYIIWQGYRHRLLKWAVSIRKRELLRIDVMLSSKTA